MNKWDFLGWGSLILGVALGTLGTWLCNRWLS